MQVILLDKVANLGNLGDVVKVKEGYARNYLIPKGLAKRATAENLQVFEERRAELERIAAEKLAAAQAKAEKLAGMTIEIARKAGVDGRLFGSVTSVDVVEALAGRGVEIEKANVRNAAWSAQSHRRIYPRDRASSRSDDQRGDSCGGRAVSNKPVTNARGRHKRLRCFY